ncbi:Inner membrane protein yiaV precursor [Raoultella terrigena]|nr:Inner membrane protein yiaV precursor [Raoultella terrigena]
MQNVSQQDLDKVRTAWQSSEQSVSALSATIDNLHIQRGDHDEKRNVTLQKYRNALEEAELNLSWTKVYTETDGTVSNLQLSSGFYAISGAAALALVNNQTDIVADFREKSLRHTHEGTDASVVFDAFPVRCSTPTLPAVMPVSWRGRKQSMGSFPSQRRPTAGFAMLRGCAFT